MYLFWLKVSVINPLRGHGSDLEHSDASDTACYSVIRPVSYGCYSLSNDSVVRYDGIENLWYISSSALCSCTVCATHCFRRRIIMSVWKCDTVCVYWQSVSLEWPTNRLDFDHHPTSVQYLVNSINLMFPCFQVTGAWTNPSPHCGGTTYPARRPISLWRWGTQTFSSFLSQKQ